MSQRNRHQRPQPKTTPPQADDLQSVKALARQALQGLATVSEKIETTNKMLETSEQHLKNGMTQLTATVQAIAVLLEKHDLIQGGELVKLSRELAEQLKAQANNVAG